MTKTKKVFHAQSDLPVEILGCSLPINFTAMIGCMAHGHRSFVDFCHDLFYFSSQVGDIISVIDMPPSDDTIWWRGKRGFEVRTCTVFGNNLM